MLFMNIRWLIFYYHYVFNLLLLLIIIIIIIIYTMWGWSQQWWNQEDLSQSSDNQFHSVFSRFFEIILKTPNMIFALCEFCSCGRVFTKVWETANIFWYPELFKVFLLILTVLWFRLPSFFLWSPVPFVSILGLCRPFQGYR